MHFLLFERQRSPYIEQPTRVACKCELFITQFCYLASNVLSWILSSMVVKWRRNVSSSKGVNNNWDTYLQLQVEVLRMEFHS